MLFGVSVWAPSVRAGGVIHQAASRWAIRRMLKAAALQTMAQFIFLRPRNIGRRSKPYCFIHPNGPSIRGLALTLTA